MIFMMKIELKMLIPIIKGIYDYIYIYIYIYI